MTPIRRRLAAASILASSTLLASATGAVARDLSFEDRVRAQEAIERVYYSHQIGATRPFEMAIPRKLLEIKVLLLHGLLHLKGYDHERDKGRMVRREEALRRKLGLPLSLTARSREVRA